MSSSEGIYPQVSTYQFKCQIAKYIRALQMRQIEGVVIKNYNQPVALVIPLDGEMIKPSSSSSPSKSPSVKTPKKDQPKPPSPMEHLLQILGEGVDDNF